MKKALYSLALATIAFCAISCASAEKMAKDAENVKALCTPEFLTLKGGKVETDVTVTCPKNYFNPKAIVEVTPVIVYDGGEEALEALCFQGEKVQNNYRTVAKNGGVVNQHLCFNYKNGMAKSHLELRGRCTVNNGKTWVTLPTKKVAEGCNITETLAGRGFYSAKDSGYQTILTRQTEGHVMYNINSSEVRSSELNNQSIKDFLAAIKELSGNDGEELASIDVVAYASPDGKEDFNNRLSDNRSRTADKAFKQITKKNKLNDVEKNVKSVGEDWDGFKQLVFNSNIEDKDLILRVLSMYNDPRLRENEIRNMSSVFEDLAKDILPQLRRARFIANIERHNYSDAELLDLVANDIDALDENALLKTAELTADKDSKKTIYNKAVEKFGSKTALFNLAVLTLDCGKCGNVEDAEKYLADCDAADADVINLKGVCQMRKGNLDEAEKIFKELGNDENATKNLGLVELLRGNYSEAMAKCGKKGVDAGVAHLLAKDIAGAIDAVKDCNCPKAHYLRAIALNRLGKVTEAKAALEQATNGCKCLAKRAETDVELANLK